MGKDQPQIAVNTVNSKAKAALKGVLASSAPKRKQQVLIPKNKRVQRRPRPAQADESEEIGTQIKPMAMTIASLPAINKENFKHWKPWLEEQNLPEWAEKMQEKTDLKTLLTKDSKAGEEALLEQAMWW